MPVKFSAQPTEQPITSHTPAAPITLGEGEEVCMKCNTAPATYASDSCKHTRFCKSCAMKCATGGKCKVCHQFYTGFTHLNAS